jgi:catechol 2,3-dioxygenase-like lactoylglutathione lyase family enzyme
VRAHLRVARATNDLHEMVRFYGAGLGFEVIASFEDHEGFDGVMLGHEGVGFHLEFTRQRGVHVGRAPNEESLLVFYLAKKVEWELAVARMVEAGYEPVPSHNPYWDARGRTFEDADGYRVVLQNAAWEN